MKINTTNLVATEALWTALVNQADHRVSLQDGERLKSLLPYQVYHTQYDSGKQRLIIMGNNKAYAVDRNVGVEDVTYDIVGKNFMNAIVHKAMGWDESELTSDQYLAGLIEFIGNYRQSQGRATREQIAEEEIRAFARKDDDVSFEDQLQAATANMLTSHSFYDQNLPLSDLAQLCSKAQPQIDAGVYAYASFDGKGIPNVLVFVSPINHNVLVAYRDDTGRVILTGNSITFDDFLKETKPRIANILKSLHDQGSVVMALLDTVDGERPISHSHTLDDLINNLRATSRPRARLALAGMMQRMREAFPGAHFVEIDELAVCPGCGERH